MILFFISDFTLKQKNKKRKQKKRKTNTEPVILIWSSSWILYEFQQWAVHTTATWMSQQVPPVRDTIAAAAPADHRCHMPWTIQVITQHISNRHSAPPAYSPFNSIIYFWFVHIEQEPAISRSIAAALWIRMNVNSFPYESRVIAPGTDPWKEDSTWRTNCTAVRRDKVPMR